MDIRQLQYFIAVAEELNFTRAAQKLNISQPPLSFQIKKLEEDLGGKLLLRNNKSVELTEAGRVLYIKAQKLINDFENTKEYTKKFLNGIDKSETISIGFSETAIVDLIPLIKLCEQFYQKVDVHRMSTTEQLNALENKRIDLGLLCTPISNNIIRKIPIRYQKYNIVLPISHDLAKVKRSIEIKELVKDRLIITPREVSIAYFDSISQSLSKENFFPESTITAHNSTAIIALVTEKFGVAFLPESMKEYYNGNSQIIFKDVYNSPEIETSIAWNPNAIDNKVENLIDIYRDR